MSATTVIVLNYDSDLELIIHKLKYASPPREIILTIGGSIYVYRLDSEKTVFKIKEVRQDIVVVFDQMFHGFANIVSRELPSIKTIEILGRGINAPIQQEDGIILWPAKDDYDVIKTVEKLAKEYSLVILFTGDKKLAKQAALILKDKNVIIEYMPPGEYPGKEALAREMIVKIKKHLV